MVKRFPGGQPQMPQVEYSEPQKHIEALQERLIDLETTLMEIGRDFIRMKELVLESVAKYKAAKEAGDADKAARFADAIHVDGEVAHEIAELLETAQKEHARILRFIESLEAEDASYDSLIEKMNKRGLPQ